ETYEFWKTNEYFDAKDRQELAALNDEKDIEDRFYKELEFGTAGLRGILGLGSNRMNKYNVKRATAGFAQYLLQTFGDDAKTRGVAIAYDCRNFSKEFALETALTMCAYGIPAHLYSMISATPLLSWTVRALNCVGGVVVTASHNPAEYNGYKAYDETGCQLYPTQADEVISEVSKVDLADVKTITEDEAVNKGLLKYIGNNILKEFTDCVEKEAHEISQSAKDALKVVYTPLHGAGNVPVRTVLKEMGFNNVSVVKQQELPDGNFPTVTSPNPGDESALKLAMEQAEAEGADIVVGSDPDSDRIGMAARGKDGKFEFYSGNQICAMLIDYVLMRRKERLKENSALITTIVTSEFGSDIARKYGLHVDTVLTGFKFIGELMTRYKKEDTYKFEFGYEESNGCLVGDYARDKDSVVAIMLMCEMAAYNKAHGRTIVDVLSDLYKEYGYYLDHLDSFTLPGKDGAEKIKAINAKLRELGKSLDPDITDIKDYSKGIDNLPPSDVLKYWFKDGSWMAIRPSGTEPKIKVYYCIHNDDKQSAEKSLKHIQGLIQNVIDNI
ncbi:MAG: phospho-sugar mutase, partial [Bacillota bacterium]|nr:phospho-sugar mutase [Bacillota bacterium]